jgi:hypothetical protein
MAQHVPQRKKRRRQQNTVKKARVTKKSVFLSWGEPNNGENVGERLKRPFLLHWWPPHAAAIRVPTAVSGKSQTKATVLKINARSCCYSNIRVE